MTPNELQRARRTLHMTQQELAACLGVARNTVARWEMGAWAIPITTGIAVDFLMKELTPATKAIQPAP